MKWSVGSLLLPALCAPVLGQTLRATRIASGIPRPTDLASPPGETSRLFVVEGRRAILLIKDGVLLPTPFLDLSAELSPLNQAIGSLAFHPDYATNGRFFVLYVDKDLIAHVAEYHVSSDPDVADPSTRVQILGPFQQTTQVHLWNQILFGPDGMLYVGIGDDIWTDDTVPNYSQDLSTVLGKILRLDIDLPAPYIPPDNPFVGVAGARGEIWMLGLRQPWRFSIDSATSDVYIGEVGSNDHEELNIVAGANAAGANFGWRCLEAFVCENRPECIDCMDPSFLPPIYEYPHTDGRCAIIGGYVYRGQAIPWLQGTYLYGDYCSGKIWSLKYDGDGMTDFRERTIELHPWAGEGAIELITSFAQDSAGELYVLDNLGGEVFKIVDGGCDATNYCVSSPNSAGPGAVIGSRGSMSIGASEFELTVSGAIPQRYGLFFYGPQPDLLPFGDGLLCINNPHFRLKPPTKVDAEGNASWDVDFENPPESDGTIHPGSTWYFQFWYRDPQAAASGFNLSDGLSVEFCP